jgi:ACS family sodium-dependent inorganic phosphate cotransporter
LLLEWIPIRGIMCLMMFTACWTSYMCRLQMPILAIPMIVGSSESDSEDGVCVKSDNSMAANSMDMRTLWYNPDELLHEIARDEILPRLRRQADEEKPITPRKVFDIFTNQPFAWSPFIRGLS